MKAAAALAVVFALQAWLWFQSAPRRAFVWPAAYCWNENPSLSDYCNYSSRQIDV